MSNVILQMLSMGVSNISKFNFLEPPPQDAIDGALRQLSLLGALQTANNNGDVVTKEGSNQQPQTNTTEVVADQPITLSPVGKQMSTFPLDPKFTKALLAAHNLGCT